MVLDPRWSRGFSITIFYIEINQRTMTKKKYHVTRRDDGTWQGKLEKSDRASTIANTKAEAMKNTIALAKNHGNSQVFIHGQDGKIKEERTYGGNDPSSSPG